MNFDNVYAIDTCRYNICTPYAWAVVICIIGINRISQRTGRQRKSKGSVRWHLKKIEHYIGIELPNQGYIRISDIKKN